MTDFQLSRLQNSSVWRVFRLKDQIDLNPVYQREGDIWTRETKQLLIDTIINMFDVPKIYLHKFSKPELRDGASIDYAVIDGKQRLTAIWEFISGSFALADDFDYLRDSTVVAKGLTYADLARKYPDIKADFDSYTLDVVCFETEEPELIEELFSRLNEAVPLNAPEKRNAAPGLLPGATRALVQLPFFTCKLPFNNRRYRHLDLAAKLLLATARDEVVDTKKAYLDRFFLDNVLSPQIVVDSHVATISAVLDSMSNVFVDRDPLLRQVGMVMLYFYAFKKAIESNVLVLLSREALIAFDELRKQNRVLAESDIAQANYKLLEFDKYTQSPNDGFAMKIRLGIFDKQGLNGALNIPAAS